MESSVNNVFDILDIEDKNLDISPIRYMKYSVKNFRIFESEGVTLDIAPITILTGCNSSGKSSIAKSLLLLDSFLSPIKEEIKHGHTIDLNNIRIDFNKQPYNLLGNFDKVLNRNSEDGFITLEYTMHSPLIKEDVIVRLKFGKDNNDELGDAFLKELSVLDCEGETIINKGINWDFFSPRFFTFVSEMQGKKMPYNKLLSAINNTSKNIVDKSIKYNSLYTFNLFDWMGECTCDNIKNVICSHLDIERLKTYRKDQLNEVKEAIELLTLDFCKSGCHSFMEYFKVKEEEIFNYNIGISSMWQHYRIVHLVGLLPFIPKYESLFREKGLTESEIEEKYKEVRDKYALEFDGLYQVLCEIEHLTKDNAEPSFMKSDVSEIDGWTYEYHFVADIFSKYIRLFIEQLLQPDFLGMTYISSSRVNVKRLYTLEENDDFALLLKRYFEAKRQFSPIMDQHIEFTKEFGLDCDLRKYVDRLPDDFINKWLKKFRIAHHISIRKENHGVSVYLYDDEEEKHCELLADKGYGITQLISILLEIETMIMVAKNEQGCVEFRKQLMVIEEPEIHLHPNYQSLLADMFLEVYQKYNIHFIIETHSEYLIRRTQVITSEQQYESQNELNERNAFKVYYITKDSQVYDMRYKTNGMFAEKFGEGFMDEASKMHMTLLKNDRR